MESTEVVDAGKARVNTVVGGGRVAETILEHTHRRHSWRIDESPLPMNDFVGSISVRDDAGLACVVECDATFEPNGVSEAEAAEMVRQFFQGGLDAL